MTATTEQKKGLAAKVQSLLEGVLVGALALVCLGLALTGLAGIWFVCTPLKWAEGLVRRPA